MRRGQNAAALTQMGYDVVAVEPMAQFLQLAQQHYSCLDICWRQDSLPDLSVLDKEPAFDFILLDGVWHHLNPEERKVCMRRLSQLLKPQGVCAISLRNGPAGLGSCVYPTSNREAMDLAENNGLKTLLALDKQASKMPNKKRVIWSRLVLQKL